MTYEQIQDQLRCVEAAIARLCETGGRDRASTRAAFHAVLGLAQFLVDADSDDERVSDALDATRGVVGQLLGELGPYVDRADLAVAGAVLHEIHDADLAWVEAFVEAPVTDPPA